MPRTAPKKPKLARPIPTKPHPTKGRDGHGAHWHTVIWLAAISITFSVTAITLSATAKGSTGDYTNDTKGVLRAISDLRKDIREINGRVTRLENSRP